MAESPTGEENFEYVGGVGRSLWVDYFKDPVTYLWNDIWVELFWRPFVETMQNLRDGQPTVIDTAGPTVSY